MINLFSSLNLLFVLDKFDNLVKNGRISKVTAFIATALYIKPLCLAQDGIIDVYEKPRTRKGALNRLVDAISKRCDDTKNRVCVIGHCKCKEDAEYLKQEIGSKYQFKDIVINENDTVESEKTLVRTDASYNFNVPTYKEMVQEMRTWVDNHKDLYPNIKAEDK